MPSVLYLKVISIVSETENAVTVQLNSINGQKILYRPGQFLTLIFFINGKENRRSFSFSSSPETDEYPAITVKRIPNGEISSYIYYHLKVGEIIQALPPSGRFTLDEKPVNRTLFMIAAGSGITPVFSIIKNALHNNSGDYIVLIYSNRNEKSTIFYNQIHELEQAYSSKFSCIFIFSEPVAKNYRYKGHLGLELLKELIIQHIKFKKSNAVFMLCGPFDYMRNAEMIIIAMGFLKTQVRKENFVILAEQEAINTAPTQTPGNKKVTLVFNNQQYRIDVPVGKTILKAAIDSGIHLPYSCQGGICGTCSAICTHGEIEMSINEVLTPKELKQGWILTCVGYPVSDTAEIKYQ